MTIAADAKGTYTVTFTRLELYDEDVCEGYSLASETVTATITVSEPVDTENPKFTVYYQISGNDTDGDNFYEVDPGAEVNVDVYVKADQAVTMQAFDIYPKWDEKLEFVSIEANTEAGITVVNKMTDVNPHFQTQFAENLASTDVKITTEGTKVATMTLKLSDSAVHNTPYSVWIDSATNLAKANDAESVANVTVQAKDTIGVETLKTYTVTYDANGGTWGEGASSPTQTKYHGKDLTIVHSTTNPTRENYSFQGWSTTSGDSNTENAPTTYTANEDMTLYAVWEQNVFTVLFFDAVGNEITDAKVENVQPDTVVSFNGTNPTKDSTAQYTYSFKGWGVGENATTTVDLTTYKITADTNFYPVYEEVTREYTVTWYDEDGTTVLNTAKVKYGEMPTYTGTPTKDETAEYKYSFAGWSASEGGDVLANLPTVDGDEAYYAIFTAVKQKYEVTYNAGEHGTLEGSNKEIVEYNGTPQTDPTVNPNDGYTFIGWSDGTTTYEKLSDIKIHGKTTLTAQYAAASYTITLNPDGGTVTAEGWEQSDNNYTKDYTIENTDKLPAATKTGYAFNGWKLETTINGWTADTYGANTAVTGKWGNVTLVAQWTEDAHEVKQSSAVENGEATPNVNSAKEGDTVTVTVKPADGYVFDANTNTVTYTYTDADSNKQTETITVTDSDNNGIYTGTFTMVDYPVEINATFTAINYTVKVTTPDHGEVTATPTTAIIGTEITLSNTPAAGYQLASYKVTNDTTNGDITVNDGKFTMPASDVTVTATFEGKSYTIIYDANGGTGTTGSTTATFGTAATLAENGFTRTGYEFKGWSTESTGNAVESFNPETYAESYTLYAVWEAKKVNVTLNYGYGDTTGSLEVTYDSTYTGLETPVRTGYTFQGWFDGDSENAQKVETTSTVTNENAHTLYARWTINQYTITFDTAGGSAIEAITKDYGAEVGTIADPTKTGYTFTCWNETIPTTMPAENMTITASWTINTYTITFEVGGNGTIVGGNTSTQWEYNIETNVTLPSATSNDPMYKFTGWSVKETIGSWKTENSYSAGEIGAGHYGNVVLNAVYAPTASFKVVEYKYAYTDNYLLTVADNLNTDVNSPTKTYTFNGNTMYWTDAASYKVNSNDIGTFYLLVDETYVDVTEKDDGTKTVALKADAYDKLKIADSTVTKINYSGDINTDGKVNIADANAVYQMVLSGGGYYSKDQLNDGERLMADMNKDAAEAHASIADVNAIVTIINNAAKGSN